MLLATLERSTIGLGPLPGWNNGFDGTTTRYAAFSILDKSSLDHAMPSLVTKIGHVVKDATINPLFRGTNAWEHDIDNGYSSVLYDPHDELGVGKYRVYYSAGDPSFGGAIPGESTGSATLYAKSDDGVHWMKPNLGRFPFGKDNSTANNIMFDGATAVAIYDDRGQAGMPASHRFKAWGNLPETSDAPRRTPSTEGLTYTAQLGGTAASSNGVNWTSYRRFQNPSSSKTVKGTLRFDAEASLYFDPRTNCYVGTMRAFRPCKTCGRCPIWWQPHGGCQSHLTSTCTASECNRTVRAIGTSTSSNSSFHTTTWGANTEVHADHNDPTRQFYSQVSWPFYNIYLGIVMVFSAVDPPDVYGKGKVHCELAWSRDGKQYTRVNPGFDFIPHGSIAGKAFDSHICFASAHPLKMEGYSTSSVAKTKEKSGKTKTMETTNDSEMFNMSSTTALHHRVYYFGGDGPHCTSRDVCLSAFSLSFTPSFAHSPLTTATTSPSPSHKQIYP
jgi:hypothetical protein